MANQVIAILGAGNVGMALARAFVAKGESVVFGVPDPDKYRIAVAALGPVASIGSTGAAVAASDLVIMATPYSAALSVAGSVPDWANRILVDATNPLISGARSSSRRGSARPSSAVHCAGSHRESP